MLDWSENKFNIVPGLKVDFISTFFNESKSNFSPRDFVFRRIYIKWWDLFRKTQKQPPEGFYKKVVVRSFTKFTGKHLFSCEFCENSKNPFFTEHLWWLLLSFPEKISSFYINSTKNKMSRWKVTFRKQVFSYEFCEISKNTFSYRTPLVAASETLPGFFIWFTDGSLLPRILNITVWMAEAAIRDVYKKLNGFARFTRKHLCWIHIKKKSKTGVFWWILQNF